MIIIHLAMAVACLMLFTVQQRCGQSREDICFDEKHGESIRQWRINSRNFEVPGWPNPEICMVKLGVMRHPAWTRFSDFIAGRRTFTTLNQADSERLPARCAVPMRGRRNAAKSGTE